MVLERLLRGTRHPRISIEVSGLLEGQVLRRRSVTGTNEGGKAFMDEVLNG